MEGGAILEILEMMEAGNVHISLPYLHPFLRYLDRRRCRCVSRCRRHYPVLFAILIERLSRPRKSPNTLIYDFNVRTGPGASCWKAVSLKRLGSNIKVMTDM
jgi:hypothetical protein